MIDIIVLLLTSLLLLLVLAVVFRAIINKQTIFGHPPIPVFYFILAKVLVLVNLGFLLMKGLGINVNRIFEPNLYIELIALLFLIIGITILFLSTFQLNQELIFGLSDSQNHKLHTTGIYSISRHPFYLGFIFVLFSSCLFSPDLINISAFAGAWIIHHFIMIGEEQFLASHYGKEYRQYLQKVKRYLTL